MMKVDLEATERAIRESMTKLAANPQMQHAYGKLQASPRAIDVRVAVGLWALSLPEDIDTIDVLRAGAILIATLIDNMLDGYSDEETRHQAMHVTLALASEFAHDMMGFADGDPVGKTAKIDVVMKDVGDA